MRSVAELTVGRQRPGRSLIGPNLIERSLGRLVGLLQFTLLAVLLVCAGYQSYYIFFKALYFRIREIDVKGSVALDPREIVRISGLQMGDLFFQYNYEKVRANLMENPRVEEARIVVRSPNAVEIQIRERQPYFQLIDAKGTFEVDRFGGVLGKGQNVPLPGTRNKTLPQLKGGRLRTVPRGWELDPSQGSLLSVWVPLLERGPLSNFTELDIASPYRVTALWNGVAVYLGDVSSFQRNLPLIARVLEEAQAKGRQVSSLDLRFASIVLNLVNIEAEPRASDDPDPGPEPEVASDSTPESPVALPSSAPAREQR